jgi:hypothetical protein
MEYDFFVASVVIGDYWLILKLLSLDHCFSKL